VILPQVPFDAHVALLQFFLGRRADIVERMQGVLNAQRKPAEFLHDRPLLSRHVEDSFFVGATPDQWQLKSQLDEAYSAHGFTPRDLPGLYNGLADPAEMMIRGFHLWQQTRWPGRPGRLRYAHTLFNLYLLQRLELLSLRLWDAGSLAASGRLAQVQSVLEQLWQTSPADQPVLVRDARWLIPLAQSPATDDLGIYFEVAEQIAESLPLDDRLAICKAGVRMTGGHLRSQIRYYALKRQVALDDEGLARNTRTTNALDFALLVHELVPLLAAYEQACQRDDRGARRQLADAICQGISPDPELFLNRRDLLSAYSMIEPLFVTPNVDGPAAYSLMGQRHVQRLHAYDALLTQVAPALSEDCNAFRPVAGTYSPYGVLYGFSSNLIEHMAFKTLQPDAVTRFGLEDVFAEGDADTLAWVSGWRRLPHVKRDVETQFDYPQQFAEDIFARVEQALRRRADGHPGAVPTGRLFIDSTVNVPDLPIRYITSSDRELVVTHKAEYAEEPQLLSDRREGRCIVSCKTAGGWVAISKAILTDILGAGRDAKVAVLPPEAAGALELTCPGLVKRAAET
jgi:hypothetical protein